MACPLSGRNPLALCNLSHSLPDAASALSVLYNLSAKALRWTPDAET